MSFSDPVVGEELPLLDIELDRTAIVAAAIASQDFEDVHHDPGKAQERGSRDIILSINTTNGIVDRYVTDWAGPGARIHRVSLKLGVPGFAGDAMRMTGEVTAVDGDRVSVKVRGANSLGVHVTADVVVGASKEGQQS